MARIIKKSKEEALKASNLEINQDTLSGLKENLQKIRAGVGNNISDSHYLAGIAHELVEVKLLLKELLKQMIKEEPIEEPIEEPEKSILDVLSKK